MPKIATALRLLLLVVPPSRPLVALPAPLLVRRVARAPLRTLITAEGPASELDSAPREASTVPTEEAPADMDRQPTSFSAGDYLDSISRYADDGRSLLRAPQRYSSQQWRTNLGSIVNCRILRAVRGQLLWQMAWALAVTLLYMTARGGPLPALPALPHSLLGGVMGVLLGFRTNQSYDRFWEGRKLWGRCFDACRNIGRSSLVYLDADRDTYDTIIRHLKAFPYALKQHLRGEFEMGEFVGILEGREINMLATADNLPLSVCTSLSMVINPIKLDDAQSANSLLWWTLEDKIAQLSSIIADCERLVRTPVPLAYAVHTSRLLSLWVGTLPFVLVGCFASTRRLLTVPLTAFVAWALFCTEELGHIIEEPFGAHGSEKDERTEVLPLDRYCASLQTDLSEVNRFKSRALKDLDHGDKVKDLENGEGEGSGSYGPDRGSGGDMGEISEMEAIEIAMEAKQTWEAVKDSQAEQAWEAVKDSQAADAEQAAEEATDAEQTTAQAAHGPVEEEAAEDAAAEELAATQAAAGSDSKEPTVIAERDAAADAAANGVAVDDATDATGAEAGVAHGVSKSVSGGGFAALEEIINGNEGDATAGAVGNAVAADDMTDAEAEASDDASDPAEPIDLPSVSGGGFAALEEIINSNEGRRKVGFYGSAEPLVSESARVREAAAKAAWLARAKTSFSDFREIRARQQREQQWAEQGLGGLDKGVVEPRRRRKESDESQADAAPKEADEYL